MIVKFNRKRNPGHPDDFALEEGYQKWAIAYYEELEFNSQHSEVIKFTFLFKRGTNINDITENGLKGALLKVHSTFNFVTWTFVIDIGMIISRYFKGFTYYLDIHAFIFTIVDFGNIIIISMTIYAVGTPANGPAINQIHKIMGIIFFSLVVCCSLLGMFVKMFLENKKTTTGNTILRIRNIHKYMAYLIWILGKVLVLLGEYIHNVKINEK